MRRRKWCEADGLRSELLVLSGNEMEISRLATNSYPGKNDSIQLP